MNATAVGPLVLTDDEHTTLLEVLEQGRDRLLVGIRHTKTTPFKNQLKARLEVVSRLIAVLQGAE